MEKYRAWDMAVVAIILRSRFTSGSCGSTARSRESAKALLVLEEQNYLFKYVLLSSIFSPDGRQSENTAHLVSMVKPPAEALSTSWLKNSCRGGGCRLSRAWLGNVSWILRATQWLA